MFWSSRLVKYAAFPLCSILVGIVVSSLVVDGGRLAYSFAKNEIAGIKERLTLIYPRTLPAAAIENTPEAEMPIEKIGYFVKDLAGEAKLGAEAYLVGDLDTGEIILEKNKGTKFPIASVSKLMTALVAVETFDSEEIASVSSRALATYGTSGNLRLGEKLKIGDLLYSLLLESSNDTGEVLAEHLGRPYFLKAMNDKAYALNMTNTAYEDPTGLSPKNVSTVEDLFKLARYIRERQNEIFEITRKPKVELGRHAWFNNNNLIHRDGYLGGKSGYIDEAKKTGVSLFELPLGEDGTKRNLAVIVLRSTDRFRDTTAMVSYLKNNFYYGRESLAQAFFNAVPLETLRTPTIKNSVTLAFVGDIMLDRGVRRSVEMNYNGNYSFLFKNLKFIREADIAFGNLEGPLSDRGTDLRNLYSFRMAPEALEALREAGFDAFSLANNHIGDWGREAFTDTLRRLEETGISAIGAGTNESDAEKPKVLEVNGIKIGFIGFSDVGPAALAAGPEQSGILLANNPRLVEIIQNASREVDALVVAMHWGEEYKEPTERQRELARLAIDAGAKIIVGSHPHIIQETEEYEGGLILYSLGNFIFDQSFSKETMEGLLSLVEIDRAGNLKLSKKLVKLDGTFRPAEITNLKK